MGFKTDREFLRNVTIGAVGTRQVKSLLEADGCRLIELERYSQSNKIWATKVKRLRVPDLLCIRCGRRIESRAKADLQIRMSHGKNNPDRAWDHGLRDEDCVAFIQCSVSDDLRWLPSRELALVNVGDLRRTEGSAKESAMKSAAEGSEVFLTWPACVPRRSGSVTAVATQEIKVQFEDGKNYTYKLSRKHGDVLVPHVQVGDHFGAGSRIVASVLPKLAERRCESSRPYDFTKDLQSTDRETVYAAVKAVGFLPEVRSKSIPRLRSISEAHSDSLVRLEAAASLAQLGESLGWDALRDAVTGSVQQSIRMEAIFILGEIPLNGSLAILAQVAADGSAESEIRAAAVWSIGALHPALADSQLIEFVADSDELVAVHAIVALSRLIDDQTSRDALNCLGNDSRQSAGIVRAMKLAENFSVQLAADRIKTSTGVARSWLVYLLAILGRARCASAVSSVPGLLEELEFFWSFHGENWTNRVDVADEVDYLRQQIVS